ncbi:MAG TPA: J domain-containing protein [Chloroflexota bacterium]|nr:J domain-containing protein [Chloroflexota bacterium]
MNDFYRLLQVAPQADTEAIHAAYRRLARVYHPDLNQTPEAAERMRAINAAYRVLSDPAKRAAYDAYRYLPGVQPAVATTTYRRTAPPPTPPVGYTPPTQLQRRVDRIVIVVGIILLLLIAFYTVNVIPFAERQFEAQRRALPTRGPSGSASTEHPVAATVPQRLRGDDRLRSFPGTVLVAPESLPPFSSLPIAQVDGTGQGIARYAVYYGDWSVGGATISGLIGRSAFDNSVPRMPNCAADDTYCTGPAPGQTAGADGLELFRAPDLVGDLPAVAIHRVCCNGTFWSVAWYEPKANVSYAVDLSRALALQFGSNAITADNLSGARGVASLAKQLVRLPS